MKALKMRSLFLPPAELEERLSADDADSFLFPLEDSGFKERLNSDARLAHMHILIGAFARYKASGLVEPACITEMVDKIIESSDPRMPKALEFINEKVDFNPVRTPEFAGKKYYAWIPEKELMSTFWAWYTDEAHADNWDFRRTQEKTKDSKKAWKAVLNTVMKGKGRAVKTIHPTVGTKQLEILAYDKSLLLQ
jgi:hypothetical protein